ncbi:MAG: FecR domain-containing protein [Verrucomicrobia bacterium]|nr:FecR domain-containing protein [Verrucomicrobiota bacterium]
MNQGELEELMAAWLAGELDPEDERKLESILAHHPEALEELAAQKSMDAALRVLLDADRSEQRVIDSVVSVLRAKSSAQFQADFMRDIRQREPGRSPFSSGTSNLKFAELRERTRFLLRSFWLPVTACLVVLLVLGFFFALRSQPIHAGIRSANGDAIVQRGRRTLPASDVATLRSGDVLKTGPGASAVIEYRDEATKLEVKEATAVKFAKPGRGKKVELRQGAIACTVAPQPSERPLVVLTPQAETKVIGTRFALAARRNSTWLEVSEGAVDLKRIWDGVTVRAMAGEFTVAARGLELRSWPATGGRPLLGPLPVRLQLFSEYKEDQMWRVSRESIQQMQVETSRRSFQFQPLEGSYSVEVLITMGRTGPGRNSQGTSWGFGVGLARWQAAQEKLQPYYCLQVSTSSALQSKVAFTSDWPPTQIAGAPVSSGAGIPYRAKLIVDLLDNRKSRVRGKVWLATETEPAEWMADTGPVTVEQAFDRVVLATTAAAATFNDLKVNFLE